MKESILPLTPHTTKEKRKVVITNMIVINKANTTREKATSITGTNKKKNLREDDIRPLIVVLVTKQDLDTFLDLDSDTNSLKVIDD